MNIGRFSKPLLLLLTIHSWRQLDRSCWKYCVLICLFSCAGSQKKERSVVKCLAPGPDDWLWAVCLSCLIQPSMEVLFAVGVWMSCSRLCGIRGIFSALGSWVGLRDKIIPRQVQYGRNPRRGKSHVYLDI